ncbi:hypothetical protein ACFC0C_28505 [Streptomyces sp. NPDC056178]|uniref:hypothetical protein n=1 Tax=unclassified Streptomyces TaxID=2593676 RepID=UPI0035E18AE5
MSRPSGNYLAQSQLQPPAEIGARAVGGGWQAERMNGDEQLLRGRVYGHDHDDPNPGPLPHQTYAALVGGPLGCVGER